MQRTIWNYLDIHFMPSYNTGTHSTYNPEFNRLFAD